MTIKEIISLAIWCVLVILLVVSTVFSFVKKVKAKKQKNEPITADFVITELLKSAVDAVKSNEQDYAQLIGDGGGKAGAFKRERVLNAMSKLCAVQGLQFNEQAWAEITDKLVELININNTDKQSKRLDAVTEEGTGIVFDVAEDMPDVFGLSRKVWCYDSINNIFKRRED